MGFYFRLNFTMELIRKISCWYDVFANYRKTQRMTEAKRDIQVIRIISENRIRKFNDLLFEKLWRMKYIDLNELLLG